MLDDYESILDEVLRAAPDGIDTRQGSIFFDAVSAVCFKISEYYADLRSMFALAFLPTAVGEYLDNKGAEFALTRNEATAARYAVMFDGAQPALGERFFAGGVYFSLNEAENGAQVLVAEVAGTGANGIVPGTAAVPVHNIAGLQGAAFGKLEQPGTDVEGDDAFRKRIREKLAGRAQNGNKQQFQTWCEAVPGVGRAHIIPLWNGPNTVKGVLFGPDGGPVAEAVVERVQQAIDPGATGLGDGLAAIGAVFTAQSARALAIDVAFEAVVTDDVTTSELRASVREALGKYLQEWNMQNPGEGVIRISAIGALLHGLPGLVDYNALTLNGRAGNVEVGVDIAAVAGEVTVR